MRYCYILLLLFLLSCTKSIEINIPNSTSLLVINCLFNPDSNWSVFVGYTGNANDTFWYNKNYVADAVVELWEDSTYLGKLQYTKNGYYTLFHKPSLGHLYKLKAKAEGYPEIVAQSSIPAISTDMSGYWDTLNTVVLLDDNNSPYPTNAVSFTFKDIQNEPNYYKISLSYYDSCVYDLPDSQYINHLYDHLWTSTFEERYDDPAQEKLNKKIPYLFFTDISFQNTTKSTNLYAGKGNLFYHFFIWNALVQSIEFYYVEDQYIKRKYLKLYVDFSSLSPDLYAYYLSYYQQAYATADPFATFGNVHSNIKGGLGIFGGYHRRLVLVYSN